MNALGAQSSTPAWRLDADELMQAYGRGTLSPVEVVSHVEQRMLAVNPTINAIATWDGIGALKAAEASERRWQARRPESPLDGIPVVVDDCLGARDLPCRWGSLLQSDAPVAQDTRAVETLRRAGAIVIGKGVTSELGLRGDAANRIDGPTLNPWDPRVVIDGGCTGAAASVAAGIVPLAVAIDHGGGIRRVAGHAGLVGATPGRPEAWTAIAMAPEILPGVSTVGLVGRTARDTLCALRMLHPAFAPAPRPRSSLRIVYWSDIGTAPLAPAVDASMNQAIDLLWLMGHEVIRSSVLRSIGHFSRHALETVRASGIAAFLEDRVQALGRNAVEAAVTPAIARLWQQGARLRATDLLAAQQCVRAMEAEIRSLFNDVDLILTPTNAAPSRFTAVSGGDIRETSADPAGVADFTSVANSCGLPALTLPAPRDPRSGLPIGLHVIGRLGAEGVLCNFAAAWEAAARWPSSWECSRD